MDRLLNQKNNDDEIIVRVGCVNDRNTFTPKEYPFTLEYADINKDSCANGSTTDA